MTSSACARVSPSRKDGGRRSMAWSDDSASTNRGLLPRISHRRECWCQRRNYRSRRSPLAFGATQKQSRNRCCPFPGCTQRPLRRCPPLPALGHGGETTPSNLVLLCRRHNRLLHEGGFRLERQPG